MNKKDISKILLTGSARQRATILAEDDAQYSKTGSSFLTDSERQSLYDSFKTPAEGKLYNRYLELRRKVKFSITYLKQLQLLHEVSIGYLTGYCLLWDQYKLQESSYNQLLYVIKDAKTKKEAIKTLTDGINQPRLGTAVEQDEGNIEILTKGRPANSPPKDSKKAQITNYPVELEDIINAHSEKATYQLKEAKAMAVAILDNMAEEAFNVKSYKDTVTEILDALSEDRAVLARFSKKALDYFNTAMPENKTSRERDLEIMGKYLEIMGKYMVFPDPDVEPDPERVAYYINEYIKG